MALRDVFSPDERARARLSRVDGVRSLLLLCVFFPPRFRNMLTSLVESSRLFEGYGRPTIRYRRKSIPPNAGPTRLLS